MATVAKQVEFLLNGYRHPTTDEPLAGGKVITYLDKTSTLTSLWVDRDKVGAATNPIILDSAGRAEVYGDNIYKFVITDSADVVLETINGLDLQTALTLESVASVYDLLQLTPVDGMTVNVASFYDGLNIGGGVAVYDASVDKATANGGTIRDPSNLGGWDGSQTTIATTYYGASGQGSGIGTGCWVLIADKVSFRHFGALGTGLVDDRAACQALIDAGLVAYETGGTFAVGDSGTTIDYRSGAATGLVGLKLLSGSTIVGNSTTTFQPFSPNVIPICADTKTNLSLEGFIVDGNTSLAHTSGVAFGVYLLNSSDISIDKLSFNETYSNTLELIGCSNIRHGVSSHLTTQANSMGGGPQFEDCNNVDIVSVTGSTYDDLVSIIAHSGNSTDITVSVTGTSENARALFVGMSGTATSQRTISDVMARVNSYDCGINGVTGAFIINKGGIYKNIHVTQVDRSSYIACRITPFDATYHGELLGCVFNITSHNSDLTAFNVQHDDHADTKIENCKVSLVIRSPNYLDSALGTEGAKISGGTGWDVNVNMEYPSGKTNAGPGMVLGGTGTNNSVINSVVRGVINGGDVNLKLNNSDQVDLSSLALINTENANSISLELTSNASNITLGSIIRDGEILDDSTTTRIAPQSLFRDTDNSTTGSVTTEVDLKSYTLPGRTLGKTGVVRVKASGVLDGTNGDKTLTFYWGGTTHTLHPAANNSGDWSAEIYIMCIDARNAQRLDIVSFRGSNVMLVDGVSDGVDTTADIILKFTGQVANVADFVSCRTMTIDLIR